MRATGSATDKMHRHLRDEGLTGSQFGVLEALLHLGPLCQREIGNKILKTGGNMTLVIDNLEKRGLVERVQDEEDRRYLKIHLTDQGMDLISRVFPVHAATAEEVFAVLNKQEQEQLGRLLKKLGCA
jgi:MarR family 2-MHQ and catechol resistance regulon transcriptional repressor